MRFLIFLICIGSIMMSQAQVNINEKKSFVVGTTTESIEIDGDLKEAIWSKLTPAKDFIQYFPSDSLPAKAKTEIYMCTDKKNLYIGIKCYSTGNDWIVNSLRRDYRAGGSDNITLLFDTFDDGTNALYFGVNPEGVLREGIISNGGSVIRDFSTSWDNKWRGNAKKYDGYYTAELEIPFSTLRYPTPSKKWGFSSYRFDSQTNEISTYSRIPRNQIVFTLAYMADMIWEEELNTKSSAVSLIPFVSSGINKDYEDDTPTDNFFEVGGDAKIALTPGLNLDLTVNPDFSQVEVDEQITNLDRFEIFFPERRQFFLENADLFGQFGFANINPFFSRRIGVGNDVRTDELVQNRIYGGLRISGKLDPDTRIGLLNMQTASSSTQGIPSINYGVAVAQRKLGARSNIGFIAVNKQTVDFDENLDTLDINRYNRMVGVDFNYATRDNTWSGKTFAHGTFSPNTSLAVAQGSTLNYNTRKYGVLWKHEYVDEDYNAEVGFVPRKNYFRINPVAELRYYPQNDLLNQHNYRAEADIFWRPDFGKTDHFLSAGWGGEFTERSTFRLNLNHNYVYLFDSFDPTGTSSLELDAEQDFSYVSFTGNYRSDRRKVFSWSVSPYIGEYFNGWRYGTRGSFNIRYQPRGSFSLNYAVNYFDLPHLDGGRETFLISPRVDYTFSKSLFTSLFVQYNSQSDNTNINARIQWRFAPVSDLILVYTDNYLTGDVDPLDRFAFNVRTRSIVLKITYWLNL
ncbi:DUF5916 domain-containing protein [Aquimarina sp. 2201CG5-10]|uniref:DUF5916 domain-containing protein n=1 Tax=Aquimarina callyspongiae TaxID=3098150 RepID=UPI002AB40B95|nr:DUF5916 domain-containing protein [Aquimarina sp. 2201CG5-10]MDY8136224.1 DUF5916 domain-containing protein [Aquimarina sp. 2201CG5-10]